MMDKSFEGTSTNLDTTHVIIEEDVEDVTTFREKKNTRKTSRNSGFSATAKLTKPHMKLSKRQVLEKH